MDCKTSEISHLKCLDSYWLLFAASIGKSDDTLKWSLIFEATHGYFCIQRSILYIQMLTALTISYTHDIIVKEVISTFRSDARYLFTRYETSVLISGYLASKTYVWMNSIQCPGNPLCFCKRRAKFILKSPRALWIRQYRREIHRIFWQNVLIILFICSFWLILCERGKLTSKFLHCWQSRPVY